MLDSPYTALIGIPFLTRWINMLCELSNSCVVIGGIIGGKPSQLIKR
jgi:hypothetical protein